MKCVFTVPERTHGPGPVFFTWQLSSGNHLTLVIQRTPYYRLPNLPKYYSMRKYDQCINIYDRHGERKDQISLPGMCVGMSWDKDGDILGIINDRSPVLILWDASTQRITQVDTGLRDVLSLLLWSNMGPVLAVGTVKGNLLIYNHRTSRKVPVLGKHSRRITFGAWSRQNYLALVGEDRMLTVSNQDGDTVCQAPLKADASLVHFSNMKQDDLKAGDNTVSLVLTKKTLYLLNIYDPENVIILAFQERYGSIVDYKWYGDGNILLGFSHGFFVVISTHMKEIGQELVQVKVHKDHLTHMATCLGQNKVAACGDNTVKLYDLSDLQEVQSILTVEEEQELDWLEWTEDGQLLAAAGSAGGVHVYLTRLPVLGDSCGPQYAFLTSLLEVTVSSAVDQESSNSFRVDVEPGFLSLGPFHLAIGMNNRAWFYGLGGKASVPLRDKEYLGTVQSLKMNSDYAAVLFEGRIQLHMIEGDYGETEERESRLFPDRDFSNIRITCHAMTPDFLIYGTNTGSLQFFFLEDWQVVNEYRHPCGLRKLFPDPSSTRLLLVDDKNQGHIYNPVNDQLTSVPDIPQTVKGCLWDTWPLDKDVFVMYDENQLYTYVQATESIEGPKVEFAGLTKLSTGQFPLLLYNGELICQTQSGKTATQVLSTHQLGEKMKDYTQAELREALKKTLKLRRYYLRILNKSYSRDHLRLFREAWSICQLLNTKEDWESLGFAAMHDLDIELAIRVYQHVGDVGMVWSLQSIKEIEDRPLLAGHLALFQRQFQLAQDLYLSSGRPVAALEMRRDLLHWDQALQLAGKLAPDQVPFISREYAQQLEFVGDYANALNHYEKGLVKQETHNDHNNGCMAGIARMAIRCSDIRRGVQIAFECENRTLKKECAEILENMKQYAESAMLYENGNYFDKAASLFIKLKNWKKMGELLPNVISPKIHGQYAKAREAEGYFKDAVKAYEAAGDHENVIRLHLDHLNNPEEAVRLVKQTKSVEGAKMVARFFQRMNDMTSAVQFLVMSRCSNEAFQLAEANGKMDIYADVIGEDATQEDYLSVATYYEADKNYMKAGKFFLLSGQYKKAVKYLMRSSGTSEDNHAAMQLMIRAVGAADDEQLTRQVIEYLMGENDGVPKDFKYLFRLYMALRQFREAAKTATIIAREEQNAGNYRNAHDVLLSMYQELRKQKIKIPSEMYANLMILHSYILVKIHVKRGDHLKGARMLIRVANNISKFPSHIVPILTSTVIECHRANLKQSAFSYAAMLMRPEYRSQIDAKYKKKIEAIVRKPQKTEEEEETTGCPYCGKMLPQSELSCLDCRNNIPFCAATGWHILKENMTACPHCEFPAVHSEFLKLLETEETCPMCSEKLKGETIVPLNNMNMYLYPEGED